VIRRWLVGLVGVRHDLLDETPVDRFRYVALAGVLLTTAAIACVSAAFALQMAVHVPIYWAAVLGIGWGVVILNLDRALIIGMTRRSGWWRNLLAALPRLVLAFLLGTVISTPLVLRIFQSEIDAEMQVQQHDRMVAFQHKIDNDPRYQAIPGLQQQLDDKNRVAAQDPSAIDQNQAVQDARKRVDDARQKRDDAQQAANGEIDGSNGTHVPGIGDAAKEKLAALQRAQDELDAAEAALQNARTQAAGTLRDNASVARRDAAAVQQDLNQRIAERQQEIADNQKLENNDSGLLARLEALGALSDNRPDLGWAQRLLFLLFLTIEVLPVFVKLLQLSAPPTLYEKISAEMEKSAERAMTKMLTRYENVNDAFDEMRASLEYDQVERQRDAGLRVNERLIAEQSARAEQEVPRFAQEPERYHAGLGGLFARARWSRLSESVGRYVFEGRRNGRSG
jgi:hypothetical protein